MKLFIPQIDDTIICDKNVCTSLVIENPNVSLRSRIVFESSVNS